MTPDVLHGWISEMEEIEDYYSRWGSPMEKAASAPLHRPLMYGTVSKDKREKKDLLKALPAVAATLAGAVATKKFRSSGSKKLFNNILLYAGAGATTGWLPLVYRDAYRTIRSKR